MGVSFRSVVFTLLCLGYLCVPARAEGDLTNLSLALEVGFGQTPSESLLAFNCQGTLVHRAQEESGWKCAIATAAHCVHLPSGEKTTFLRIPPYGFIKLERVEAKSASATPSPREDVALLFFREACDLMEGKTVSIYSPEVPGETIERSTELLSASRAFSTLLPTRMRQTYNFDPETSVVVSILTQKPVMPGDSGGGIFLKNPRTKNVEIFSVLAGAWVDRKVPFERLGGFKVGASGDMNWIRTRLPSRIIKDVVTLEDRTPTETKWRGQFDLMDQFLITSPGSASRERAN